MIKHSHRTLWCIFGFQYLLWKYICFYQIDTEHIRKNGAYFPYEKVFVLLWVIVKRWKSRYFFVFDMLYIRFVEMLLKKEEKSKTENKKRIFSWETTGIRISLPYFILNFCYIRNRYDTSMKCGDIMYSIQSSFWNVSVEKNIFMWVCKAMHYCIHYFVSAKIAMCCFQNFSSKFK